MATMAIIATIPISIENIWVLNATPPPITPATFIINCKAASTPPIRNILPRPVVISLGLINVNNFIIISSPARPPAIPNRLRDNLLPPLIRETKAKTV